MSCDLDLNPAMEKLGSFPTAPEQQPQEPEGAGGRRDSAVQSLVSSEQWLRLHGLKSRRLTLKQILSQIGFPHQEDYVTSLGRFVASRYADGLFPQCGRAEDGSVYHLTAKSDLILQFAERLARAAESYRQRMDWLTSGSRQVFGVLLEQCVAVVLDWGDAREEERPLCRAALTMVLQEQVARVAKFNLVAVSQEPVKWQESAAPVTEQSIAAAVKWVEQLPLEQDVSPASRLAALLAAGADTAVECIYYFVVGDVPDDSKELLLQKAAESPCPVCTVSFNARGDGATAFLKDLSARTHGRFHAFAQRTECVDFPAPPLKEGGGAVTWNSRKLKGTLPPERAKLIDLLGNLLELPTLFLARQRGSAARRLPGGCGEGTAAALPPARRPHVDAASARPPRGPGAEGTPPSTPRAQQATTARNRAAFREPVEGSSESGDWGFPWAGGVSKCQRRQQAPERRREGAPVRGTALENSRKCWR